MKYELYNSNSGVVPVSYNGKEIRVPGNSKVILSDVKESQLIAFKGLRHIGLYLSAVEEEVVKPESVEESIEDTEVNNEDSEEVVIPKNLERLNFADLKELAKKLGIESEFTTRREAIDAIKAVG